MTPKQYTDIDTVSFFIPLVMHRVPIMDRDIQDFLEYSEQGKHQERIKLSGAMDGFNALVQGKRWRGIHMQMWEDGVISGDMPYSVILHHIPRSVAEFASREMFKGADKDLIMKLWGDIHEYEQK